MPDNRSVITFANNNLNYAKFALNCAQSILLFNDIKVFIVSNLSFDIPQSFQNNIFIVKCKEEHAQLGIEGKLYINEYLQTEETLFIDSDCLCYSSLNPIFTICNGMDVSVVGKSVPLESFWGDERAIAIRDEFGINETLLFNGAFYYLKNTIVTEKIFKKARKLAENYEHWGFGRLKNNWKNEENLLSMAMAEEKQKPIADDGRFMTDLVTDQRPAVLNILKGKLRLRNSPYPSIKNRPSYPPTFSPIILHFGGNNLNSYPYASQRILLKLNRSGLPVFLSSFIVFTLIHLPYRTYHWLRATVKGE